MPVCINDTPQRVWEQGLLTPKPSGEGAEVELKEEEEAAGFNPGILV